MSKVLKCDRCGAIYEDNIHKIKVEEKETQGALMDYWDLCDACAIDFHKFMKKEETEK